MTAIINSSTILANITFGKILFTNNCEGSVKIYPALEAVRTSLYRRNPSYHDYSFRDIYTSSQSVRNTPFPYDEFIGVLRSVKSDPFTKVSSGAIVDWIDNLNTTIADFDAAVTQINSTCFPEYCRSLAWKGNPDLAGVGAFASYVIGVAFASLFALAIVSHRLLFKGTNKDSSRFHEAIRASFGVFWDSAFLFNMAVTIAVVVSMQQNESLYNQEFTRLSASISWAIVASTWPFYASVCHHPTARWVGMWAATTAFTIISSTLMIRSLDATEFERSCLETYATHSDSRQKAQYMSNTVPSGLLVFALTFSCVYLWKAIWNFVRHSWAKSRLPEKSTRWVSKRDNIWRHRWRIACATVWCVSLYFAMIACLISFALKREMTAEVAGPSLEESKWGFGQVMALTTWLPTVVDFVLIAKGSLKAVVYRLPLGVDVSMPGEEKELLSDNRASDDNVGG